MEIGIKYIFFYIKINNSDIVFKKTFFHKIMWLKIPNWISNNMNFTLNVLKKHKKVKMIYIFLRFDILILLSEIWNL